MSKQPLPKSVKEQKKQLKVCELFLSDDGVCVQQPHSEHEHQDTRAEQEYPQSLEIGERQRMNTPHQNRNKKLKSG